MTSPEEKQQFVISATHAVGALMEAALNELPASTREKIALSLAHGGELAVLCSLLGVPRFIGMLMEGPDAEPIRLFEIVPSSDALPRDTVSH